VTSRKFDAESVIRFAKKASFPAILAIPLVGGAIAASWSGADSAQAVVIPAEAAAPEAAAPEIRQGIQATPAEESVYGAPPAALETSAKASPQDLQEAALAPAEAIQESPEDDPDAAPTAEDDDAAPAVIVQEFTVSRGDTLMQLLVEAGVERSEAHKAVTAMEPVFSARHLRAGQDIKIAFADTGEPQPGPLLSISFRPNRERDIEISRFSETEEFFAEAIDRPVARQLAYAEGSINSSLSVAANNVNVPNSVLVEAIRSFSYDVDFQREIQKGDSFEFLYEIFVDETGDLVRSGELLFAAMTLSGSRTELFYYERADGSADFYTAEGASVRRSLMRTPIDGARLSSGFGMRKHPILGYSRMHRGTDFAAPSGTPIYAAGNGVIDFAGRKGGYGKYVRIRHGSSYQTAYAHMKSFAKGIKKGTRVKQGQVIGYVGTTGRSTGPHLHYEVLLNGKQLNPLKVTLPRGEKLKESEMADFAEQRAEITRQLALAQGGVLMVQRACEDETQVVEQGSTMGNNC
jgi:murein DD-endopeptidase MepM/ murein hydrolase activator NlpD